MKPDRKQLKQLEIHGLITLIYVILFVTYVLIKIL